jgi:heterodisulfide reductase subunit B
MTTGDKRNLSLFTGCLIPSKFSFIEMSSRRVLERLGITLHKIDGASCCPNQMAIQASDKDLWYTVAARNLALAEQNDVDIVSLCNGCYDTLKSVNSQLKADAELRGRINGRLAPLGLEFAGTIDVKHVVQVLHDDVGTNTIDKACDIHLDRFSFAPFVGCHVKRPMDHMGFDDPEEPYYLKALVKATGAKVKRYPEMDACCGGGFSIGRKNDVVPAARRLLHAIKDSGADGMVVNCPYCFSQFITGERGANDLYFEDIGVPVLYITELIGLAMGLEPSELGLHLHYPKSVGKEKELVERILGRPVDDSALTDEVTRKQLETCLRCLACTDDCPAAMTVPEYQPEEVIDLVLEGRIDEAVARSDIWYCINCHECVQHCPQGFGMVRLWILLKNLATEKGIAPEVLDHRMEALEASGFSFAPDEEIRDECGLDCIQAPDMEKFKRLIEETRGTE